jgi:hypothetical protein
MMQTMNSPNAQPPSPALRVLLLTLSAGSGIGAVLSLMGYSPLGFFYLVPLAMVFLLLRALRFRDRLRPKEKAPSRSARPGA